MKNSKENIGLSALIVGLQIIAFSIFLTLVTNYSVEKKPLMMTTVHQVSNEAASNMVVKVVNTGHGIGTGFYVQTGNRVVVITNRHVCDHTDNVSSDASDLVGRNILIGKEQSKIIHVSDKTDLCMIETKAMVGLKLANSLQRHEHEEVYTIGYPRNFGKVKRKMIFVKERIINWVWWVHRMHTDVYDAHVDRGQSGSPIFNKHNEVVGVIFAKVDEKHLDMTEAVPLKSLVDFIYESLHTKR
jgi:S1-C subfamily serine protease